VAAPMPTPISRTFRPSNASKRQPSGIGLQFVATLQRFMEAIETPRLEIERLATGCVFPKRP
jgi:hypothetical protein